MDLPEDWLPHQRKPSTIASHLPALEIQHSKVLARLRYDEATRELYVEFRSGAVYRYFGVSRDDYTKLATSASPGARFNTDIAPYHECERLA